MVLFAAGCTDNAKNEAALSALENDLKVMRQYVVEYSAKADAIAAGVEAAQQRLADPNLNGDALAKTRAQLAEMQAVYATVRAKIDQYTSASKDYETKLAAARAAGAGQGETIAVVGEGAKTIGTFLPPPFNLVAEGVGALLVGVGGYYAKKRQSDAELATSAAATVGIVKSVDALLASPLVTDIDAAKKLLAYQQAKIAPEAVAAVQQAKQATRAAQAAQAS